jgi:diguanylate cyclase (GGDEF)-like protein
MRESIRTLRPMWAPALILAATTLAVWLGPPLAPSLAGLRTAGPYAVLATGLAVAWWFNRGRSFVFLAALLAAYGGDQIALEYGDFAAQATYTLIAVLVPLNVLLALLLPERGTRHAGTGQWLLFLAAQALLVFWIAAAGRSWLLGEVWHELLEHWALRSPPTPFVGRVAFGAAFVASVWRSWPLQRPPDVGIAGALGAFFIASEWARSPGVYSAFMTAAGAILIVALLQESHRLAFRDELTGLPGRRALEERLHALGDTYAIAMVDVDHFKRFNDDHGHDIGDQVLKLVAARLAEVGGGGAAFRYGGEEFTVIFPGCTLEETVVHLEAIRASIQRYRMALRGDDRPKKPQEGAKLRAAHSPDKTVSVTVSIGAAEPGARLKTPAQVVKAADEALYRAKKAGRNRVVAA